MDHDTEHSVDLRLEHQVDLGVSSAGPATPIQLSRAATTEPDPVDTARVDVWRRTLRARRLFADVVVLALIAVLAFALWPARLGGATSYVIIKGTSMEPKFHTGDLAVVRSQDHYNVGDIVAYRIPKGGPGAGKMVIHRIIGHHHGGYLMQGDNRTTPDTWNPTNHDIVGRYRTLVPIPGIGFWTLMPWVFCGFIGLSVIWILWPHKLEPESDDNGSDPDDGHRDDEPVPAAPAPVIVGQRRLRRLACDAERANERATRRARPRVHRRGRTLGLGTFTLVVLALAIVA